VGTKGEEIIQPPLIIRRKRRRRCRRRGEDLHAKRVFRLQQSAMRPRSMA